MRTGDHLRVLREGRWDHAIDCGDRTVIHFAAGAGPAIRRSPLADFARTGERVEVVPHAERVYPPREVVARAYSRMRGPSFVHMFADAEQFAVWCKSGFLPPPHAGTADAPGRAPAKVRAPRRTGTARAAGRAKARAGTRKAARAAKRTAPGRRKRR
jgi:hypothetical protein